ncbi:hypothetical protein [Paenibacillus senegalensis]|uniref:hypothetical protein n=1 Tax=Paenibacillus senegalensis TaxID=1465766 RepID=UPI0002886C59|nr:hypothetical protein [Paenibacillus senegalensis]
MTANHKRCLFCEKPVNARNPGNPADFLFQNCFCSPDGQYEISAADYELLNAWPHADKRGSFHLISGYIRELTDQGEHVRITRELADSIQQSPLVPASIEAKKAKCLLYLKRHASGPLEPVQLTHLSEAYHLTYSPNLQEFIYILEEMKSEKLIERIGSSLSLTSKGWEAALKLSIPKGDKTCFVAIHDDSSGLRECFEQIIIPQIGAHGFEAILPDGRADQAQDFRKQIAECDVVIADFTLPQRHVYFEAGYAEGRGVPVIYTLHAEAAAKAEALLPEESLRSETIFWDTPEELAELLKTRLGQPA